MQSLVTVIIDTDAPEVSQAFTYRVPAAMDVPPVGSGVIVPFGAQTALGFVVGPGDVADLPAGVAPKAILERLNADPFFDEEGWDLARWMAERYYASPRDCLRCIVPDAITAQVRRGVRLVVGASLDALTERQRQIVRLIEDAGGSLALDRLKESAGRGALDLLRRLRERGIVEEQYQLRPPRARPRMLRAWRWIGPSDFVDSLPARQAAAAARLRDASAAILQSDLLNAHGVTPAGLAGLQRKGLAAVEAVTASRDPFSHGTGPGLPPELTPDQVTALSALQESLDRRAPDRYLLHGVTASGKTEVYLGALDACLKGGRSGLLLVPEISLTAQVMHAVRSRFGGAAAVLHSALSDGERYDEWARIRRGDARVVVGARSAIFAPLPQIGLIVLDEEHETSYKQESTPRYLTRDVAARRAQQCGAVLVLGSATPSVETYQWASEGHLRLLRMPTRIDSRPMPAVRIVDLRSPEGSPTIFTETLASALAARIARGEQSILFLNRRGYATFILCRDCGYTARCPHCSVSLTYHAARRSLQCHHCDYRRRAPVRCPKCDSTRIRHFGLGTEKLEEETRRLFPDVRVVRMDRDTTRRKGAHRELLDTFRSSADVLIGTQMVAKGLDFPAVTLVGVITADTSINLPDFRAAERTFQLIAQVAGRAGRGTTPGEVIVQTFNPEHFSLQTAAEHDYEAFFAQEIEHRRDGSLNYPPFSRLINLIVSDPDREQAKARAMAVADAVRAHSTREVPHCELLGPAPAAIERIKGRYRWHLVVKAPDLRSLNRTLRPALDSLDRGTRMALTVDVDPISLL